MQCDYTIHVSRGSSVSLQLMDIDMEVTPQCTFDYIAVSEFNFMRNFCQLLAKNAAFRTNFPQISQIHDGPTAASHLIGTYCHLEQIIRIESTSNTVFVRFVSDMNTNGRGFELKFSASKCEQWPNEIAISMHIQILFNAIH